MSGRLIDLTLHLHHQTERAFLVSDTGEESDAVWLPKSRVEQGDEIKPDIYEFTMPLSLATEKGLT